MCDHAFIVRLIVRKLSGDFLLDGEMALLEDWLNADPRNRATYDYLQKDPGAAREITQYLSISGTPGRWQIIKSRLSASPRRSWHQGSRLLAAAAILFVVVFIVGLLRYLNPAARADFTLAGRPQVPPGVKGSYLFTSAGLRIDLDSVQQATFKVGQLRLQKDSNCLHYPAIKSNEQPEYHRVTNTATRQCELILADGSHVWLDARSSIRFPSHFSDTGKRTVELDGQAYFEVTASARRPFIIVAEGPMGAERLRVQALGTRLNVNAFTDSQTIRTTLFDGAARLSTGGPGVSIHPGKQGIFNSATSKLRFEPADTTSVLAWKCSFLDFYMAPLTEVLKGVGEWYGVHFTYKGHINWFLIDAMYRKDEKLENHLAAMGKDTRIRYTKLSETEWVAECIVPDSYFKN